MIQLVLFIFGASLGSFINVLALRYDPEKSFWTFFRLKNKKTEKQKNNIETINRSHCPHCGKVLQWYELIPIVSFIIQAGQCRGCKKSISWQYPVVEVVMGTLTVLLWRFVIQQDNKLTINNQFLLSCYFAILLLLIASLITIALIDLRTTIIPDELVIIAFALTILTFLTKLTVTQNTALINHAIGLLIGGGVLTTLWAIGRGRWMGLGDGKLGVVLGLWLGYPTIILALSMAFISGSIISIGLIALQRKTFKDTIPFGPFLVLGGIITFFFHGWFEGWWHLLWL